MKLKFVIFSSIILSIIPAAFISCGGDFSFAPEGGNGGRLSVLTWNLQTFFDGKKDGCEYSQFLSEKYWGRDLYQKRLKRLTSSLKELNCDILVMEEVENEGVLYDIYNFMAGEWDSSRVYKWACFAKEEYGAIGIGILSRYPLENMKLHCLDILSEEKAQPSMRPLLEVDVKTKKGSLTLIANHWKSMKGGKEESEVWRKREEGLLEGIVRKCLENNKRVIALGDFNRSLEDFASGGSGAGSGIGGEGVLLRPYRNPAILPEGTFVKSCWYFDYGEENKGSYFYKDEWSRIDNIFYGGDLRLEYFAAESKGDWCDKKTSVPQAFTLWNGSGYSDHLPLKAEFIF
ncbi:endonuclease/exonuclease/phosphatase family protein [Treponema sp.]|uniref:endonuclease/exonuclease/phosphatase family protein n=1 Tax=Treponema sp. TaxID=166 RepID=UPI0025F6CED8|nr:endonuclease/exonuclease/phosphatase family protein [Treponema sp.]MCR5217541.1 endonuclease/exonuclease/phosphatase family protein [Treponema sp.]